MKIFGVSLTSLTLAKFFLVLYLLGMLVADKRPLLWPVINWPMYSAREFSFPAPTTSAIDIVALTQNGKAISVPMGRLVTTGREVALIPIFKCAAGIESEDRGWQGEPTTATRCQNYLSLLLARVLPEQTIRAIEIADVTWSVDPLAGEPVDHKAPIDRRVLGRFEPRTNSSSESGP